jgi:NitT/TauT family transport system substrate-binding protein
MRPDPAGSPLQIRRRRAIQARCLVAAASGIAVLLAAGCSAGVSAGSPVSETIKIAALPGVDNAPLYLAQEKGLFAAAGLHVEISSYGPTEADQLAAVENGQAKIAITDYANIFAQENKVPNLRILADGYDAGSGDVEILINPRFSTKLASPAQLEAVPIGLPSDSLVSSAAGGSPPSLDAAAATADIYNYLLGAAGSLQWQEMSQQQEIRELQSGHLEAALLTEPYIYQAQAGFGALQLMDVFSGQTANLPVTGYVATSPWVKANAAAVADFQSAIAKAQAEASSVGAIQQTLVSQHAAMNTADAEMVNIGTYPTVTSTNALERVVQLIVDAERMFEVPTAGSLPVSQMVVRQP